MVQDFREGFKFTRMTSQKDYLVRLQRIGEETKDVISLAKRVYGTTTSGSQTPRNRAWERLIMMKRIGVKWREIKSQRIKWMQASKNAEGWMPTAMKRKYRYI